MKSAPDIMVADRWAGDHTYSPEKSTIKKAVSDHSVMTSVNLPNIALPTLHSLMRCHRDPRAHCGHN